MPAPMTAESLADVPGIAHGFFTRAGGVSSGLYASLNCGLGSRDVAEAVLENRTRVAGALGGRTTEVTTLYQVHSARAHIVEGAVPREALPQADAVVTRTPGLIIGALSADCAPVLFADPEARIVAAAHAGWRGAVAGVLEAAISAMEAIGADRARIRAAIGPCIGQAAYEVGLEFEAQVVALDPANSCFFMRPSPGARPHFDLPAYVEARLARAGLTSIEQRTPCTYVNESNFFSYRRSQHRGETDYGRQISAIVVT